MKVFAIKILCVMIAAILFLPLFSITTIADDSSEGDYTGGGKGKGSGSSGQTGGKNKGNIAPVVTIIQPMETSVSGESLDIVVRVTDEDPNPIASIYIDLMPVYNTGNSVTIDISNWASNSEHVITAVYIDSGGKIGGDDQLVTVV